MENYIY